MWVPVDPRRVLDVPGVKGNGERWQTQMLRIEPWRSKSSASPLLWSHRSSPTFTLFYILLDYFFIYISKVIPFPGFPIKIPCQFFVELERAICKFIWNNKKTRKAKIILNNKRTSGGNTFPYYKLYYRAVPPGDSSHTVTKPRLLWIPRSACWQ